MTEAGRIPSYEECRAEGYTALTCPHGQHYPHNFGLNALIPTGDETVFGGELHAKPKKDAPPARKPE